MKAITVQKTGGFEHLHLQQHVEIASPQAGEIQVDIHADFSIELSKYSFTLTIIMNGIQMSFFTSDADNL